MTQAPPARPAPPPWRAVGSAGRAALALFTIIPVRAAPAISRDDAARAIRWLPAAGVLIAAPAA
ncbi:MAG TPA: hypothetical protein VE343_05115, partial [Streptosporangiaceae bacterium]|nr:hypothetical protein [Streptosporangiaceae bacterium]